MGILDFIKKNIANLWAWIKRGFRKAKAVFIKFTPENDWMLWYPEEINALLLINEYRVENGVPEVAPEWRFLKAANERNYTNIKKGGISHGVDFFSITRALNPLGVTNIAENLGYSYSSYKSCIEAWKRSKGKWRKNGEVVAEGTPGARYTKGHNDILLDPKWTHCGPGMRLGNNGRWFFCGVFGKGSLTTSKII